MPNHDPPESDAAVIDAAVIDAAVIGGGAAGLAASIFLARARPDLKITILDGAKRLGAKVLISGGGRCNVTNVRVTTDDFCGGSPRAIQRVLRAFSRDATVDFFRELGVAMYEEEHGKLFPVTNKARTVLDALMGEAERCNVQIAVRRRVERIRREEDKLRIDWADGSVQASSVLLATGGQSVPKTGSDGTGYELARSLDHSVTRRTPALAPLLLEGHLHAELSGNAQEVVLTLHATGNKAVRCRGAMLWTHFGVSGPVALDISRHWHAADADGKQPRLTVNFLPDRSFAQVEEQVLSWSKTDPRKTIRRLTSQFVVQRLADALCDEAGIAPDATPAELPRETRRKLVHALVERPLPVVGSRGFRYAEATAGGVPLSEVNPSTLESRRCPGLFLAGEILDVDGRIGGFNFQWAWSSAAVAARGMAARDYGKWSPPCPS